MLHKTPIGVVQSQDSDTDFLQKTTNNNKNLELHNQKLKERNSA